MTSKGYPALLYIEQSISFIADEQTLNDHLYFYSDSQKEPAVLINNEGVARNINEQLVPCPALSELTETLKLQLQNEGQCCLQKLKFYNHAELFSFMESLAQD